MLQPDWVKESDEYLSEIGPGRARNVQIYRKPSLTPFMELSTTGVSPTVHVTTAGEKATSAIRRDRRVLPKTRTLYQDGVPQWDLTGPGFLRRRYKLTLPDGNALDIKTPFFSIWTFGTTAGKTVLIARVEKTNRWKFVIDPSMATVPLVTAIAFLHSEYYYRN